MAYVTLQGFQSNISVILLNSATQMSLPAAAVGTIATAIAGGNYTILGISDGVNFEIVNATAVVGGTVTIARGQQGTLAATFGVGAVVRYIWTTTGIQAVAGAGPGGVTVAGSGAANVSGGPAYLVDVPVPVIGAGTGISVAGTYPTWTVTNTAPAIPGPPTVVTGSGVAGVTSIPGGYNVNVPSTSISSGAGISVAGTFPNFTITNTIPAGGTGTVTSVTAGTGITVTGTPTVAPVVSLTNTAVVAGTYGGLTVNAQGQLTNVAAGLITSVSSLTTSLVVGTPTLGSVTLTQGSATTAVAGIARLAVATNAASNTAADTTSAVTPAGINAVVTALPSATTAARGFAQLALPTNAASNTAADTTSIVTPAGVNAVLAAQSFTSISGSGQLNPLAAISYTATLPSITNTLTLAAGHSAIVTIYSEVYDTVTPTNIPSYGIGLFNGATLITGNSNLVPGATRKLSVLITGPVTYTLTVKSTTLGANEVYGSYYMTICQV